MGRSRKSSPGPKSSKSKVNLAPNVVKEKTKQEPVTFLDESKFVTPKPKRFAVAA
jgi:hypothetical protein